MPLTIVAILPEFKLLNNSLKFFFVNFNFFLFKNYSFFCFVNYFKLLLAILKSGKIARYFKGGENS